MRLPAVLALLLVVVLVSLVEAQQPGKMPRVGVASPGFAASPSYKAFEAGLVRLGLTPGQNVMIDYRFAAGDLSLLPKFVTELIRVPVDVLCVSSVAIPAAVAGTRTIPLVMAFAVEDPVQEGWAASFARPGGNITGVTLYAPELTVKRLEVFKAIVPGAKRVAILAWKQAHGLAQVRAAEAAAKSLGLTYEVYEIQASSQYESVFRAIKRARVDGVLVLSAAQFFGAGPQIAELGTRHRLVIVAPFGQTAEAGSLVGYGPNVTDLWGRRIPDYVHRILKGAKAGDLPIEQADKFELVLNLKTAKLLGVTVPASVKLRADQIIE